jgi:hypothetical protein
MHLSSGLNLAEVTQFPWPRSTAMVRPVATSQTCAVPSIDADSARVPLLSNTTETTPSLCPLSAPSKAPDAPFQTRTNRSEEPVATSDPS